METSEMNIEGGRHLIKKLEGLISALQEIADSSKYPQETRDKAQLSIDSFKKEIEEEKQNIIEAKIEI